MATSQNTENVMVVVDEGVPGHDMSVEVTAKYRADGGIDILSVREHPQADPHVKSPLPAQAGGASVTPSALESALAKLREPTLWAPVTTGTPVHVLAPDEAAALLQRLEAADTGQQPAQPGSGEVKRYLYRHDGLEPDMGHLSDFFHGHAPVGYYVLASDYACLQSALAAAKAYADDVEARYHTAHERLTAARQRIAALHAALRTYGWHKPECDYMQEELPCTCGFLTAVERGFPEIGPLPAGESKV